MLKSNVKRLFYGFLAASSEVRPAVKELFTNMKSMPIEQFKEITERYGFNYGPNFWIIKHIWQGDNEGLCLVDISGSPAIQKEAGDYVIHPSILDTCLQSCFVPLGNLETEDTSIVPVGFKSISLSNMPCTKQLYCHVTADATEFGKFDVSLMSPSGKVLLTMSEFRIAELTSTPRRFLLDNLAYEIQWMEDELHEHINTSPNVTCLVLRESTEFSDQDFKKLKSTSSQSSRQMPDASTPTQRKQLQQRLPMYHLATHPTSRLLTCGLWKRLCYRTASR